MDNTGNAANIKHGDMYKNYIKEKIVGTCFFPSIKPKLGRILAENENSWYKMYLYSFDVYFPPPPICSFNNSKLNR